MNDANCGPSNALKDLSRYTDRDQSLQNEFIRNDQGNLRLHHGFKNYEGIDRNLNNEFQRFNSDVTFQGPSQFSQHSNMGLDRAVNHHPVSMHQQEINKESWVQDFNSLSIQNRQQAGPPVQNLDWHKQFMQRQSPMSSQTPQLAYDRQDNVSFNPGFRNMPVNMNGNYFNSISQPGPMSEHKEIHMLGEEQASFENHFNKLENELSELESHEKLNKQEMNEKEKEEFARTAQKVHDSMLNSQSSDETASKFQSSNFLKLMNSISSRSVELENDKLVHADDRADIRESSRPLETNSSINDTRSKERMPSGISHDQVTSNVQVGHLPSQSTEWRAEHVNHLPDPLAHIKDGDLANLTSPLQAAKVISGNQVKNNDWMEEASWSEQPRKPGSILPDAWQEVYDDYRHDDDSH